MRSIIGFFVASFSLLSWAEQISYQRDVQPILTQKCVACHACYDAPCQVNLGSADGLLRGMSQVPVYDGARTHTEEPTRLFFDAQTPEDWQSRGFHSILQGADEQQASLLMQMLALGRSNEWRSNAKLPEKLDISITRINQCPTHEEFELYSSAHAQAGMPFAVAGLTDEEYEVIAQWFKEGAKVDEKVISLSESAQARIAEWETFLNQSGQREQLTQRWLYEHLFLAHLYFPDEQELQFYQLVRSRTPSGEPIDIISTRRPNYDPGTEVYYRLWPIPDVLVHKTHITFALDEAKLARTNELFYGSDWQVSELPGYGTQHRSNPFETFAAIPPEARYQFMLDNAEYFVRTFIRGPVCRGQIATDVIRDNFWTFFQDPAHDLYITDAAYREEVTPLLSMPGQLVQLKDLFSLWRSSSKKRNEYQELRQEAYADAPLPTWDSIWMGNDNALLSIFRHHDSASVRKGLIGQIPKTMWFMDYPLFERTYYELVVNFDVSGNVSHQAQTRLYFDLIRNGAEVNFLRLMPADTRKGYLKDWYQGSGKLKAWLDYSDIDTSTPSALDLPEKRPLMVFANQLLSRYDGLNARKDPINRCPSLEGCSRDNLPSELARAEQALSRLSMHPAAELKVINQLPESTLIRVELDDGSREVYSVLRNRAHSNVAFMLGESLRYQPNKDTLTVYPEVLASYPNFMFNVRAAEVPEFVQALENAGNDKTAFDMIAWRWGIRRTHPDFWFYFHDVVQHMQEKDPVEAAMLDINRYENL